MTAVLELRIKGFKFTRCAAHREGEDGFACGAGFGEHIGAVLGGEDGVRCSEEGEIWVVALAGFAIPEPNIRIGLCAALVIRPRPIKGAARGREHDGTTLLEDLVDGLDVYFVGGFIEGVRFGMTTN